MESFVLENVKSTLFYLKNIQHIRKYLTPESTKTLVHAFVISRLDYANSLLYGISACLRHKLQVVQNRAARVIFLSSRFDRATPLLRSLHWLPIEQRIIFKILVITHNCLHEKGPSYLSDLLQWRTSSRQLRSIDNLLLVEHRTLNKSGDRAFVNCAPVLWNKLPYSLRSSSQFKKDLKTYIFTNYYS